MIKFLILAALAYFAYRLFFDRPKIGRDETRDIDEGDYTDYEELE